MRRGRRKLQPILFVPDTHRPYHNREAWELMLRAARDLHPKVIAVIGDLADCFSVSDHSKDPRRALKLDEEIADVNRALDELDALGATVKLYVAGNHEDRLKRYLQDKAPELFPFVEIPKLLRLKERGWKYTSYRDNTKLGALHLTHDVGSAGRYSTYRALDTFAHSVVTGHAHRLSYCVEGNAVGEAKVSAQFGWLGDVEQIDYMSRQKARKDWALGFGIGYFDPRTGYAYLTPVPIVNGTCVVNGKLYRAARGKRRRVRR